METFDTFPGDSFNDVANEVYTQILRKKAKSMQFRFNGVQIIMFDDRE